MKQTPGTPGYAGDVQVVPVLGTVVGDDEGMIDGIREGIKDGSALGMNEGYTVGSNVGVRDGWQVGPKKGFVVGISVGTEGPTVGVKVGSSVVGIDDGNNVGRMVGEFDG